MKAVILCAGRGTRFLPFSKSVPKEMYPLVDEPNLDYIVDEAIASGAKEIAIVINSDKELIRKYYSHDKKLYDFLHQNGKSEMADRLATIPDKADFTFIIQKQQRGTADAVNQAKAFTKKDDFFLAFGDDLMFALRPVMLQLYDNAKNVKSSVMGVQRRTVEELVKCGVIDVDQEMGGGLFRLRGIDEKPRPEDMKSNMCTLGRYYLTPEIYEAINEIQPGIGGEYQITDAYNALAKRGRMYAYNFKGTRFDIGSKEGALLAAIYEGKRKLNQDFITRAKLLLNDPYDL